MTQGTIIFYTGLGIIGITILLFIILNIATSIQKKKLRKIIQDDYNSR